MKRVRLESDKNHMFSLTVEVKIKYLYAKCEREREIMWEQEENQRGRFLAEHQQQCSGILTVVSHLLHPRQAPTE